jgi:DNA-binding response OmpR family regulator
MVTGLDDLETCVKGLEAGADDFLNKPVDPRELRERVRSFVQVKRYTDDSG